MGEEKETDPKGKSVAPVVLFALCCFLPWPGQPPEASSSLLVDTRLGRLFRAPLFGGARGKLTLIKPFALFPLFLFNRDNFKNKSLDLKYF